MSDIKDPKYENLVNHLLYGVYDELDLMRLRKTAAREIRYLSGALNGCELVLNKSTARNDALVEVLEKYKKAMDNIYNHNEASRAAVVMHFGTLHPQQAIRDNTGEQE